MQALLTVYRNVFTDNRPWINNVLLWLAASALIGVIAFHMRPDLLNMILEGLAGKFGPNPALDFNLVLGIFKNNLLISLIAIAGGLLFGLIPFLIIMANGFIIGYFLTSLLVLSPEPIGQTVLILLLGLIPHGILEIPAFVVAAAIGLRLGLNWIGKTRGEKWSAFVSDFKYALVWIPALALVMFIAAVIEVYVSGRLIQ